MTISYKGPLMMLAVAVLAVAGCKPTPEKTAKLPGVGERSRIKELHTQKDAVVRFFSPMTVKKGDWLDTRDEQGETFDQYLASDPKVPSSKRRTIYIQPVGEFTAAQEGSAEAAAEYMQAFYGLNVTISRRVPLGNVPADKRRRVEYRNNLQIRTSYFLKDILPKMIADDAAAVIAFTNFDLYSEPTRAFVFGEASFHDRVAVWSFYRFADPKTRIFEPAKLHSRTLKIAVHETGHVFSMRHCTKYECLMSGTNRVEETDRRPLDNCPECMAKIAWALNYDPAERYQRLAEYWKTHGDEGEARTMIAKKNAIEAVK